MRVHPNFWCMVLYITVLSFLSSFLRCSYFHHLHCASFSLPSSLTLPKIYIRKKIRFDQPAVFGHDNLCILCLCMFSILLSLPSVLNCFYFHLRLHLAPLFPPSFVPQQKRYMHKHTSQSSLTNVFSTATFFFFNSGTRCLKAYPCSFSNSLHCTREGVNNPKQNFLWLKANADLENTTVLRALPLSRNCVPVMQR